MKSNFYGIFIIMIVSLIVGICPAYSQLDGGTGSVSTGSDSGSVTITASASPTPSASASSVSTPTASVVVDSGTISITTASISSVSSSQVAVEAQTTNPSSPVDTATITIQNIQVGITADPVQQIYLEQNMINDRVNEINIAVQNNDATGSSIALTNLNNEVQTIKQIENNLSTTPIGEAVLQNDVASEIVPFVTGENILINSSPAIASISTTQSNVAPITVLQQEKLIISSLENNLLSDTGNSIDGQTYVSNNGILAKTSAQNTPTTSTNVGGGGSAGSQSGTINNQGGGSVAGSGTFATKLVSYKQITPIIRSTPQAGEQGWLAFLMQTIASMSNSFGSR